MRYCEQCRASFQAMRKCPRDGTTTRADIDDPLVGQVLGDRYRVLEPIAAGGMGQIYRAAHTRIASLFAVKVLYGDICYEPDMRERFAREAEVASCLQSRHIVRVTDFGEDALLYIAMEYLDGPTLESVITRDGPFATRRAVGIVKQLARGLSHAHERGVVHRDLKSSNVILVREDDEPEVAKLLDFGIAHMRGRQGLTQAGVVLGTPHYMAPEQFLGRDVDARSDLYSLGVIFYEMLRGELPFDAPTVGEMRERHLTIPPPSLTDSGVGQVSRATEGIVLRLLAKRPEDRFASARALIEALDRADHAPATWAVDSEPTYPGTLTVLEVAEPIQSAILVGAPAYNRGDHAACFEVYAQTSQALLQQARGRDVATAASARLEIALSRAAQLDPTRAAWEMRYAFDDLLHAAPLDLGGETDPVAAEIAVLQAITAPRYAAGQLDLVGDYQLLFAENLSARLKRERASPTLVAALDSMVDVGKRAGGGQHALGVVGGVLESLRSGFSPASVGMPSGRHLTACPNLEAIASQLVHAIAVGAPAYNQGDVAGCLRVYRQAATTVLGALAGDESGAAVRTLLEKAIAKADGAEPTSGAWALRHAFDQVIAAAAS